MIADIAYEDVESESYRVPDHLLLPLPFLGQAAPTDTAFVILKSNTILTMLMPLFRRSPRLGHGFIFFAIVSRALAIRQ